MLPHTRAHVVSQDYTIVNAMTTESPDWKNESHQSEQAEIILLKIYSLSVK